MENTKLEKMFFIQYWIMFAFVMIAAGYGAYSIVTKVTAVPTPPAAVAQAEATVAKH